MQFANYDFNNEWQQRFFRPLAASMCLAFLADPYDLHTHHHPENLMHILGPNAGKQLNFATKTNQGKFVGKATNLHRLTWKPRLLWESRDINLRGHPGAFTRNHPIKTALMDMFFPMGTCFWYLQIYEN